MSVDYNNFAKTFASSRKNMKWAELEYFFSMQKQESILDVGCGSGRLLEQYKNYFGNLPMRYTGVDLSHELLQEAKKDYPMTQFIQGDMGDILKISQGSVYDNIFLIASFHHLKTLREREMFLSDLFTLLDTGAKVYMTNWALNSNLNLEKYISSQVLGSKNKYGGLDYNIKIGNNLRFYHCFSTGELESLALKAGFKIIENRLFDGERNIITILEK